MRALVYHGPGRKSWDEVPDPGITDDGDVIVRVPGATGPGIGAKIRAAAPADKLHLFTADGRKRIGS